MMDLSRSDQMVRVAVLDNVEPSGVIVVLLQGPGVGSSVTSSFEGLTVQGHEQEVSRKELWRRTVNSSLLLLCGFG